MSDGFFGWRVHLMDEPLRHGGKRLIVWRPVGELTDVLVGFTERGDAIVRTVDPNVLVEDVSFPVLPVGVAEAIAEVVKPGPSQGQVAELREALTVERARIDEVLRSLLLGRTETAS